MMVRVKLILALAELRRRQEVIHKHASYSAPSLSLVGYTQCIGMIIAGNGYSRSTPGQKKRTKFSPLGTDYSSIPASRTSMTLLNFSLLRSSSPPPSPGTPISLSRCTCRFVRPSIASRHDWRWKSSRSVASLSAHCYTAIRLLERARDGTRDTASFSRGMARRAIRALKRETLRGSGCTTFRS